MVRVHQIWRAAAGLVLVALLLAACSGGGPGLEQPGPTVGSATEQAEVPLEPTAQPSPTNLPELPEATLAELTTTALLQAEHPPADDYRFAVEIKSMSPAELTPEVPDANLQIDSRAEFLIRENPLNPLGDYRRLPARVRYLSDNAVWWASVTARVTDEEIEAAAQQYEELVRPINQLIFGSEPSPGIDGDPRVHFLLVSEESGDWANIFGYFSSSNQFPRSMQPNSNQREMLVINLGSVALDSIDFAGDLAHEFQHLIHWNQDQNEDLWLNEALAELGTFLTGAPISQGNAEVFQENPNIQLTDWTERGSGLGYAHYIAGRLFMIYLLEQFGEAGPRLIKNIVENPDPGALSIQEELDKQPGAPRFNDIYANWLVANLLDQTDLQDGQFGYIEENPLRPVRTVISAFQTEPVQDKLLPYGARYYDIRTNRPTEVTFNGPVYARLTSVDPASGQFAWYSNRGDGSAFQLTRSFDLREVDSATLKYKVWYALEDFYDFAYVEVSTDGGKTWELLETTQGTDQDPYNTALGPGYTGTILNWQQESLDLTPYAGQEILLRFEVVNDFTKNREGLMLDDIEIPEIGFIDGAEDDSGGWEANGFIRSANRVPLEWILWLVKPGRPTQVERLTVQPGEQLTIDIPELGEQIRFATLIVSPAAPVTTIGQDYELLFSTP